MLFICSTEINDFFKISIFMLENDKPVAIKKFNDALKHSKFVIYTKKIYFCTSCSLDEN